MPVMPSGNFSKARKKQTGANPKRTRRTTRHVRRNPLRRTFDIYTLLEARDQSKTINTPAELRAHLRKLLDDTKLWELMDTAHELRNRSNKMADAVQKRIAAL